MRDNFNESFLKQFFLFSKLEIPNEKTNIIDWYNSALKLIIESYKLAASNDKCHYNTGVLVSTTKNKYLSKDGCWAVEIDFLYPSLIKILSKSNKLSFNYNGFAEFFIELLDNRKLFKPYQQYNSVKIFINATYGAMCNNKIPICTTNKDGIGLITKTIRKELVDPLHNKIFHYSVDTAYCISFKNALSTKIHFENFGLKCEIKKIDYYKWHGDKIAKI